MRKYIRLALILIAFFSVLTMLVYRYKYHNLQSIIEIMNIFVTAKPKISESLQKHSNSIDLTSERAHKINHWTELFKGIYVYSLHVISKHVISLAYSNDISASELKSMKCHLWYDDGKKDMSKLEVHLLSSKNNSFLYYIECRSISDFGNPSAVSFVRQNSSVTMPVFHKEQFTGPFLACISPLSTFFFDENKILEFLIYHSHLGIKHFLLYYTAFSETVMEMLIKVANDCDITIEFLPWITPVKFQHNRMKLQPYHIDCIFHVSSLNHSDFVFLLDLNNFIVPKQTLDLKKLIQDSSPFDLLQIEKKLFCLEYPNNMIAKELDIKFNTLLKTKVSKHEGQLADVIYDVKQSKNINKIHKGFEKWVLGNKMQSHKRSASATIFSYSDCGENSETSPSNSFIENKEMWSFKNVFFESCIYKHAKLNTTH